VQHCDADSLSQAAISEPLEPEDEVHLYGCQPCRGEVESLRRVVVTMRMSSETPDGVPDRGQGHGDVHVLPVPPPRRVWDRIAAETGVRSAPRLVREPAGESDPESPVARLDDRRGSDASRRRKERPATRWPALVAAAALVVGAAGGVAATRWWERPPVESVLARTALASLPDTPAASGEATVLASGPTRFLQVDVSRLAPVKGFREVWLIDPTVTKMVPIGVLDTTAGTFAIPDGLDLSQYPIVDISVEPLDGNPAHSGDSILRGTISS
jgi:hypothetical protein